MRRRIEAVRHFALHQRERRFSRADLSGSREKTAGERLARQLSSS